jgi:hypothetical protein
MPSKAHKTPHLNEIERLLSSPEARATLLGLLVDHSPKPALASHEKMAEYLGGISSGLYFARVLPELDVVRIGARTLPTYESGDRYIKRNLHPSPRSSSRETD